MIKIKFEELKELQSTCFDLELLVNQFIVKENQMTEWLKWLKENFGNTPATDFGGPTATLSLFVDDFLIDYKREENYLIPSAKILLDNLMKKGHY